MKDRKRSQFRSQSGRTGFNRNRSQSGRAGFDRNKSQSGGAGFKFGQSGKRSGSRPKSELEKKVEGMEKTLNHIKDMLEKANVNHFVEEEYELNVIFVDESKGIQMIVDSGAPVSIETSKWMERYLNEMK